MAGRSDAPGHAGDLDDAVTGLLDMSAESLHAGEGRCAVGAGREVREAGSAFGEGRQHPVSVADGLVAGQAEAPVDVAGWADEAFFRGCLHVRLRGLGVLTSLAEPDPARRLQRTMDRNRRGGCDTLRALEGSCACGWEEQ